MRLPVVLLASALAASCGGKPVGGKVPRVDPAKAAGVAAAAATLATLADPDHAKRIQERKGDDGRPGKTKDTGEQVPEEVLARAEDYAKAEAYMKAREEQKKEEASVPCPEPGTVTRAEPTKESEKPRLELIPSDEEIGIAPVPCTPAEETPDAGIGPDGG